MSYVCLHCHRHPLEDCIWWYSSGHGWKQCNWWCGGVWRRNPNGVLAIQDGDGCREAAVFRAHAAPQRVCDHLINALKLLANQQTGSDSPFEMLVAGHQERRRLKKMEELRRFITVNNHDAVKIGDLEQNMESLSVLKPKIINDFRHQV